jgi:hypothetical protein
MLNTTTKVFVPVIALTAAGILVVAGLTSASASQANDISAVQADNIFGDLFGDLADNEVKNFALDAALGVHYFQNSIDRAENVQNPPPFSPGDTFFQDGAVYPAGTIPPGKDTFDLDTPGAIGTYNVRGTWITDSANFGLAAAHKYTRATQMAFATEILRFGNHGTIMIDGMYPNAYFSAHRVVLGGTGCFRGVVGEVEEENIGETAYGCNFRLKFTIRRAARFGNRR